MLGTAKPRRQDLGFEFDQDLFFQWGIFRFEKTCRPTICLPICSRLSFHILKSIFLLRTFSFVSFRV